MMPQTFVWNASKAANEAANTPKVARSLLLVKTAYALVYLLKQRRRLLSRGAGLSGLPSYSQESP